MSVVNVEIRCRMPSFSASRVVRSARICFKRREARLKDEPAARRHRVGDPFAVDRKAGSGRPDPHSLAVEDEPRVDCPLPPLGEQRLDGFRHPLRIEPDPEAVDSDPEADELRELPRRERAHVLALERQPDRLGDERPRFGDGCFGRWGRQCRLDVGQCW